MRVCDNCRDVSKPVSELRLAVLKPDPSSGRVRPEELRSTELDLCADCVDAVWGRVVGALRPGHAKPG